MRVRFMPTLVCDLCGAQLELLKINTDNPTDDQFHVFPHNPGNCAQSGEHTVNLVVDRADV